MNTLYKNPFKKQAEPERAPLSVGSVLMLETDLLFPNPSQPRTVFEDEPLLRLADSIRRYGILQPLSVRPVQNGCKSSNAYLIIAGERRWRAAKVVGLTHVPCIILDVDKKRSAELALIENIQREDLNPFEQAAAIASLIDIYGLTQEQTAKQLSTSQSYVANKLRLLKLTPDERREIVKHKLTERHARALLRVDEPSDRLQIIRHIAAKELNVSASEKYIDRFLEQKACTCTRGQKTTGILKDLRFFYNSVDRAVGILKECGIGVSTEKRECASQTVITVTIDHP